jgi:low affinity Fe/Cu permease
MTRYRDLSERVDRVTARAWFLGGFNLVLVALLLVGLDVGNLFISIVTAELVILAAVTARAGMQALHAKLDALIHATDGASDALMRAEERDEAEIAELRS